MNPVDLAYAAGIIDGEGYIGIGIGTDNRNGRSPIFNVRITVAMTDMEAVLWLHETFGGRVHTYEAGRYKQQKSTRYMWQLAGVPKVAAFCEQILPYLRVKDRQAELVIRYRDDAEVGHGAFKGRAGPIPDNVITLRQKYAADFRALNQRERRKVGA